MHPIYGCPEHFRESLSTPTATSAEILMGIKFFPIVRTKCVVRIAVPIPEVIAGTQKIWAVPRYAHAPFSPKFLRGFCSDGPCEYTCQI